MDGERNTIQLFIRCKPSVARAFRVMAAEMEKKLGETLEVCVSVYKAQPAFFKGEFR